MKESDSMRSVVVKLSGTPIAVLFACIHFCLAIGGSWNYSPTYDEPFHIAGGYCYWAYNDYRIHPENGNLPQRMLALPIWLSLGSDAVDRSSEAWKRSDFFEVSRELLFSQGREPKRLVFLARVVNALISSFVIVLVYVFSRKLFGPYPAIVSAALACFCPNLLAHGGLATSDTSSVASTLCVILAVTLSIARPTVLRVTCSGLAVGGLLLSKYSGPLVVFVMLVVAIMDLCTLSMAASSREKVRAYESIRHRVGSLSVTFVLVAIIALVCIWLCYGMRYRGYVGNDPVLYYRHGSLEEAIAKCKSPIFASVIGFIRNARLLPEAFLYGAIYVQLSLNRGAFLLGQYSTSGWWFYFPVAFVVKSPIPVLGLSAGIVISGLMVFRKRLLSRIRDGVWISGRNLDGDSAKGRERALLLSGVVFCLVILWLVLLNSTLNIGLRHALLTYPLLYVLCGALLGVHKWIDRAVICSVVLNGCLVLSAFPNFLPYFNQFITPGKERRVLVDSNLDWGQDLPQLMSALKRIGYNGAKERAFVDYFGSVPPEAYGIAGEAVEVFEPGVYCVSVTNLVRVYSGGNWSDELEQQYREGFEFLRVMDGISQNPHMRKLIEEDKDGQLKRQIVQRMNELARDRLYTYLDLKKPDGAAGKSILLYRLSSEDIRRALVP